MEQMPRFTSPLSERVFFSAVSYTHLDVYKRQYMIVVWAGTAWSPKSREITRAVEHLAKNSPEPVLWCIQDEREEMTEERCV